SSRLASDLARPSPPTFSFGREDPEAANVPAWTLRTPAGMRLPAAVVRLTALARSESGSYFGSTFARRETLHDLAAIPHRRDDEGPERGRCQRVHAQRARVPVVLSHRNRDRGHHRPDPMHASRLSTAPGGGPTTTTITRSRNARPAVPGAHEGLRAGPAAARPSQTAAARPPAARAPSPSHRSRAGLDRLAARPRERSACHRLSEVPSRRRCRHARHRRREGDAHLEAARPGAVHD